MPNQIYWFAFYDLRSPSTRYRGFHVLKELRKKGVKTHFFTPSYRFANIVRFVFLVASVYFRKRKTTRIIIQRVHTNGIYARVLKFLVRTNRSICYYDLDDAQYVECDPETIHWFLSNVKGVFVGSMALSDYCRNFNENVLLLTSAITKHTFLKQHRNDVFTIGWIGNFWGQHEQNMFDIFLPCLKSIEQFVNLEILGVVHPDVESRLNRFFTKVQNVSLSIPKDVNWQNETEVYAYISNYDVGVSPLLDTEINRCKSAYKLKQYLSCGIPVLGSGVGENKRFIDNGKNGFICNLQVEFRDRIVELINMNDARYFQMSQAAKASEKNFNVELIAGKLFELLAFEK